VPFSAFYAKVTKAIDPIVAYVEPIVAYVISFIKLPIPMCSQERLVSYCPADNYSSTRWRAK
jgi:hypothetical protein